MIHIALPVLDDTEGFFVLWAQLQQQKTPYCLWVCVNQPEFWWEDPTYMARAHANVQLLHTLQRWCDPRMCILDRASPGHGWPVGKGGIGWARKVLFDAIMAVANKTDWIVSVDADTQIEATYLSAVDQLSTTPWRAAVIPYWHRESQDAVTTWAGMVYEIYLRVYRLQLIVAGAQCTVTPLGSAFAVRVDTCQQVSGLTPKTAGEDFYFLQKIAKHTPIKGAIATVVYPEMRRSDRVVFGTGPAISDICQGHITPYPLYPNAIWRDISETLRHFTALFKEELETPMSAWLRIQLNTDDLWGPLRKNFRTEDRFVRACHHRVDGLRIFQYVRHQWSLWNQRCPLVLRDVLPDLVWPKAVENYLGRPVLGLSVSELRELRLLLFEVEWGLTAQEPYSAKK